MNNSGEVSQPLYYVGQKTKTLKSITLSQTFKQLKPVAHLPANSSVEIIAAEAKDSAHYFLIKTAFGLLGWWKLDSVYSQSIENLYFAGD